MAKLSELTRAAAYQPPWFNNLNLDEPFTLRILPLTVSDEDRKWRKDMRGVTRQSEKEKRRLTRLLDAETAKPEKRQKAAMIDDLSNKLDEVDESVMDRMVALCAERIESIDDLEDEEGNDVGAVHLMSGLGRGRGLTFAQLTDFMGVITTGVTEDDLGESEPPSGG